MKKPLYRKINRKTHGLCRTGGEARWQRNAKAPVREVSMHGGRLHGRDYTPLFRFLLSKAGEDWDSVFAAATARLDREEPIWWMVARPGTEPQPLVRTGRNSYFSGLWIEEGRLTLVDPELTIERLEPSCGCCTHTFNGIPFIRLWRGA